MSLADPKNPALWSDGSPRSQQSGFCLGHSGKPIDWVKATERAAAGTKITASIERQRAQGVDPGTLFGLSVKSDEAQMRRKTDIAKFSTAKPKNSISIEGREAGRKSADKREAIKKGGI